MNGVFSITMQLFCMKLLIAIMKSKWILSMEWSRSCLENKNSWGIQLFLKCHPSSGFSMLRIITAAAAAAAAADDDDAAAGIFYIHITSAQFGL